MIKNPKIRFITTTALLLALTVASQTAFRGIGQWVVGPLVNLFLIVSVMLEGFFSGAVIALFAPVIALIQSQLPLPQMLFVVALGNLAIVSVYYFISVKFKFSMILSALIGSFLKFGVMYLGVHYIIIPFFAEGKEKLSVALSTSFGVVQFFTALIGSLLAILLIPALKTALNKKG